MSTLTFRFIPDLVRAITPVPKLIEMDFFKASSYGAGATETTGKVKLDR